MRINKAGLSQTRCDAIDSQRPVSRHIPVEGRAHISLRALHVSATCVATVIRGVHALATRVNVAMAKVLLETL